MKSRLVPFVFLVSATLCLASCAASPANPENGLVRIVASTNVYGDIARRIGGDLVDVVSIIGDAAKDPHDYAADAHDRLVISQADVVIENGGGYDSFFDTIVSTERKNIAVLNAVTLSGYADGANNNRFNEHVWYDVRTVERVASALVDALSERNPSGAATFHANGESFAADLAGLRDTEATLASAHAGRSVAITESVPLYMLEASGLVNVTPVAFSDAVEQDTDVPPGVLAQTLDLFGKRLVGVLFYNEQTGGPQAAAAVAAATANGIPVVPITETLPPDETYVVWMTNNLSAVSSALAG